jgi:UDP-N-acetylmuramoylalanine--D-glutamate ligase
MNPEPEEVYSGKTVLVVGAARSGGAAAEFLLSRGARVILTDLKCDQPLNQTLASLQALAARTGELVLELGGHRNEIFQKCDLVVLSPGVPATLVYLEESRRRGIPIIAEVELAYRHLKGMILGITGSNGKTTTTTLIAEILRASGRNARVAGNIGVPLVSFVQGSQPGDIYATELSSFQLECIQSFRPKVGAVLNLTPDHLDRYTSFGEYIEAKSRIFMNQAATDLAVLNADDQRTLAMATALRSITTFFSRRSEPARGTFVRSERVIYRDRQGETDLFDKREILMKGSHNLENALAACAIVMPVGASPEGAARVMRTFRGVEHRLEWVAEIAGVQYFNDSKATNVDATIKSLEAFPGHVLLIAGGRDKGADFTLLRPLVRQKVTQLILRGEAAGKLREALHDTAEITDARSLPDAVGLCRQIARPGDVVLLAPACASFDMFQNYEERGRVFKAAVRELGSRA